MTTSIKKAAKRGYVWIVDLDTLDERIWYTSYPRAMEASDRATVTVLSFDDE